MVCLLTDIAATILTGLGLRTQDHRDKHKYYRFAVFCMGIACEYFTKVCPSIFLLFYLYYHIFYVLVVSLLIALVIYPVCFAAELNLGKIICLFLNLSLLILGTKKMIIHRLDINWNIIINIHLLNLPTDFHALALNLH